jgi:NADH dehydrogenase [ubiquinone] 1 alpha subcomplex assembly factor 6
MPDSLSAAARSVRRYDRDRYLTALFAPPDRREDLMALYAFNLEVAKTRETVTEPTLGFIRLQWWRDALAEIYDGRAPRRHEVVEPLAAAIRARNIPRAGFDRILDTRERDLEDRPVASLEELEAYADGSSGEVTALALAMLGVADSEILARGRRVGIGYALAGILRAVPFHARQHRCLLPQAILAAHGATPETVLEMKPAPSLAAAAADLAGRAKTMLAPGRVPSAAWPALAPAILARRHLKTLARLKHDVFRPELVAEPGAGAVLALIAGSAIRRA